MVKRYKVFNKRGILRFYWEVYNEADDREFWEKLAKAQEGEPELRVCCGYPLGKRGGVAA